MSTVADSVDRGDPRRGDSTGDGDWPGHESLRAFLDSSIAATLLVRASAEPPSALEVVDANRAAADLFRTTGEELRATTLASEVLTQALWNDVAAVLATGDARDVDVRFAHPRLRGGSRVHLRGRVVRFTDGALLSLVDLTERDELSNRAALDERLAALGRLAVGVAHEFNNPLAWVTANLEHLRSELADRGADDLLEVVDESLEGTVRLRRIVQDLRAGTTVSPLGPGGIALAPAVEVAARTAAHAIQRRGRLEVHLPADLPPVIADSPKLIQVLLNLLINASESLPPLEEGGGNVHISARTDGDGVVLQVSDDGCGIAVGDVERAFEPFFTTRAGSGGTGLGLWISRSIMESFGGRLDLSSVVGQGTTVALRLRIGDAVATPSVSTPDGEQLRATAPLRVLVVDDEPFVARAVTRFLRGHTVTIETRPERAIARIRAGERFDVVLTDLTMPTTDGFELLLTAEMLDEGLAGRIVVMSGGTADETWRAIQEQGIRTIDKPFDRRRLRAIVGAFSRREP